MNEKTKEMKMENNLMPMKPPDTEIEWVEIAHKLVCILDTLLTWDNRDHDELFQKDISDWIVICQSEISMVMDRLAE